MSTPNVVVVSESLEVQQAFASILGQRGLAPIVASTAAEAEAILRRHAVSLLFCSDELQEDGIESLIRHCSQPANQVPVVVVSRLDDCQRYLNFLQAGAFDYVLYPLRQDEIEHILRNALWGFYYKKVEQAASVSWRREKGPATASVNMKARDSLAVRNPKRAGESVVWARGRYGNGLSG